MEKFDEQISALRANAEIAEKEWLTEKDLQRKADLEKAWKQALEREERLLPILLDRRGAVEAQLRGAGERSRCLRRDSGTRQCGICRSVFTHNIYQIVTLQIHLKY